MSKKKKKRKQVPCESAVPSRRWPTTRLAYGLLAAGYLTAAIILALTVPTHQDGDPRRTPPDESAHLAYFDELLTTHRLPLFHSGTGNYEAHQPPLFYLLSLPVCLLGRALGHGVLALRLFVVLQGLGCLAAAWLLAGAIFPARPAARFGTVAVVAFLPSHTAVLSAVSNDPLAEFWCSLALWQSLLLLRMPLTARRSALLGLTLGAAALTKTSTLFLFPVALLAVVLAAQRADRPLDQALRSLAIVLAPALALALPWLIRNQLLYGDPMAMKAFIAIFGRDRATPDFFFQRVGLSGLQYYQLVLWQTFLSFWGVFGQACVFLPSWFYWLGVFIAAAAAVGGGSLLWRGERPDSQAKFTWSILVLATALVFAFFLRFNMVFYQAQARYFFPVIVPLAAALCAGLRGWLPHELASDARAQWAPITVLVLLLLIMALAAIIFQQPNRPILDYPFLPVRAASSHVMAHKASCQRRAQLSLAPLGENQHLRNGTNTAKHAGGAIELVS